MPERDRSLRDRFGSAKKPATAPERGRPDGVSDDLVDALGKLSEALEVAEHARGELVSFHRLSGRADLALQDAVDRLRRCGRTELAEEIDDVLVGRGVVDELWTYQLLEKYDAGYLDVFRAVEAEARARTGLPRHLAEAEMQATEQQRDHGAL